jgi:act minimal PKS acyl carrier protein
MTPDPQRVKPLKIVGSIVEVPHLAYWSLPIRNSRSCMIHASLGLLSESNEGRNVHVRAEDLVKKRVIFHLRRIAGTKGIDIDLDRSLKDFGIDSITAMELVMDIEREFNINIPDEKMEQMVTPRAVISLVQTLLALHV